MRRMIHLNHTWMFYSRLLQTLQWLPIQSWGKPESAHSLCLMRSPNAPHLLPTLSAPDMLTSCWPWNTVAHSQLQGLGPSCPLCLEFPPERYLCSFVSPTSSISIQISHGESSLNQKAALLPNWLHLLFCIILTLTYYTHFCLFNCAVSISPREQKI